MFLQPIPLGFPCLVTYPPPLPSYKKKGGTAAWCMHKIPADTTAEMRWAYGGNLVNKATGITFPDYNAEDILYTYFVMDAQQDPSNLVYLTYVLF